MFIAAVLHITFHATPPYIIKTNTHFIKTITLVVATTGFEFLLRAPSREAPRPINKRL